MKKIIGCWLLVLFVLLIPIAAIADLDSDGFIDLKAEHESALKWGADFEERVLKTLTRFYPGALEPGKPKILGFKKQDGEDIESSKIRDLEEAAVVVSVELTEGFLVGFSFRHLIFLVDDDEAVEIGAYPIDLVLFENRSDGDCV